MRINIVNIMTWWRKSLTSISTNTNTNTSTNISTCTMHPLYSATSTHHSHTLGMPHLHSRPAPLPIISVPLCTLLDCSRYHTTIPSAKVQKVCNVLGRLYK